MKIAFLVSSLSCGGAERVAATLSNAWADRGHEVTLIPTFSGGGTPFYPLDSRVRLVYLADRTGRTKDGEKRYLRRLMALRRLIGDVAPDVVLSFLPNVNIAALLATSFTSVPCIVCERSDPSQQPYWPLACNALYRTADVVAVQTESVRRSIASLYGGLRKIEVLPNPLPAQVLETRAAPRGDGRRVLLSLGRLTAEKRVDRIIDAFAELAPRFPDWDLHVYGEGPEQQALVERARKGALPDGRIRFRGRTSQPWAAMSQADAFALTSAHEGFPNALLEAMGVGLPCVTVDCLSGPREITRDGRDAMLVAAGDQAQFVSALARVMEDGALRRALGEQARESVASRFGLDAVLGKWDDLFASVIARG